MKINMSIDELYTAEAALEEYIRTTRRHHSAWCVRNFSVGSGTARNVRVAQRGAVQSAASALREIKRTLSSLREGQRKAETATNKGCAARRK